MNSEHARFEAEEVQLAFSLNEKINQLKVESDRMFLALQTSLLCIDLESPETILKTPIPLRKGDGISQLYPVGLSSVVTTARGETFFVKSTKVKTLKLTGINSVISVADECALISMGGKIYIFNSQNGDLKHLHAFKSPVWLISSTKDLIVNIFVDDSILQLDLKSKSNTKEAKTLYRDATVKPSSFTHNGSHFAFSCVNGVGFGKLNSSSSSDIQVIPEVHCESIMLTKFHIFVFAQDKVNIFEQLTQEWIQTIQLPSHTISLTADHIKGTYWTYTANQIMELVSENQAAGIWKILLERSMFDQSLSILDPQKDYTKYQKVLSAKAQYLFTKGEYEQSAKAYGQCDEPLESVTLKLMSLDDTKMLRFYLMTKLNELLKGINSGQVTIIATWIFQCFLSELNTQDKINIEQSVINGGAGKLEIEFESFYTKYTKSLDKLTCYELLQSYNRPELIKFANHMQDYSFVIQQCVKLSKWDEAIQVILQTGEHGLVYYSINALMVNEPVKTVDMLIRMLPHLDILRIIPSLLTYNKQIAHKRGILPDHNQALRFLNHVILHSNKNDNDHINTTFLTILITYPNQKESHIIPHLNLQFDDDFILRLALEWEKYHTAIRVYSKMNKWEMALSVALERGFWLMAISLANGVSKEASVRKDLWLLIGEKLISNLIKDDDFLSNNNDLFPDYGKANSDTKTPLSYLINYLLTQCPQLTIHDLLPLMPDFIIIDDFKTDIVQSLTNTSTKIKNMSQSMESSLAQAEIYKTQIDQYKEDSFAIIQPYDSCNFCSGLLADRRFYAYPCFHSCHQDCIVKRILSSNDYKLKNELQKLQKKIKENSGDGKIVNQIKSQLENLLGAKCYLCELGLAEIDTLLVDHQNDEWAL